MRPHVILFTAQILCAAFLVLSCGKNSASLVDISKEPLPPVDPFTQNQRLGRGMNLGNALEAPNEGDWGVILKESYFQAIKTAGFTSIRLPVRWSAHAKETPPYTIDPHFFARVDWAVHQALSRKLLLVLNIHHYEALMENPTTQKARFLGLWTQIAEHYQNSPPELLFEILNEPHGNLTPSLWNLLLADALSVIRRSNPARTVIIGTANWGGLGALDYLTIPAEEQNAIVTIHYYEPFHFTHQGAEWVAGSQAWLGTKWNASPQEVAAMNRDFDRIAVWANEHNRPIYIGEFGAYSKADLVSRTLWTNAVARAAEARHFSWAYWEFCAGFGAFDSQNEKWIPQLLSALIP